MSKPILTIGIIFKNDIRCLEKCLKALRPLRDAIPCELVMADTGSNDGSREIAMKYADILFDFPWIDDFSAARNAVIDRAGGVWYMTVDTDEYLDSDVAELKAFLTGPKASICHIAALTVRNYSNVLYGKDYTDFLGLRLMRLATGIRYRGRIHEHWDDLSDRIKWVSLKSTILHHDGYIYETDAKRRAKYQRNMALLRKELEQDPNNLMLLMQCVESGGDDPEQMLFLQRAVSLVEKKSDRWEILGAPILRWDVRVACTHGLHDQEARIARAEQWFPESIFTRTDVNFHAIGVAWDKKDYAQCISRSVAFLQACEDYDKRNFDTRELLRALPSKVSSVWRNAVRVILAGAYLYEGQEYEAVSVLEAVDTEQLDAKQTRNYTQVLGGIHARTWNDTAGLVLRLHENTMSLSPADRKREAYLKSAAAFFTSKYRGDEEADGCVRNAYTMLLPLSKRHDLGRGAVLLENSDPLGFAATLKEVEDWECLPIYALGHALSHGAAFPPHPLPVEVLDGLAGALAATDRELAYRLCLDGPVPAALPALDWLRALTLALVSTCTWENPADTALLRHFAQVEEKVLLLYYTQTALREENLHLLPPMHRFGWYLVQAFERLDSGDEVAYVQLLRAALTSCPTMRTAVEFLLEEVQQRQREHSIATASPELLALAGQVRAMLNSYPTDDPAVVELKNSELYQSLAWLIEDPKEVMPS